MIYPFHNLISMEIKPHRDPSRYHMDQRMATRLCSGGSNEKRPESLYHTPIHMSLHVYVLLFGSFSYQGGTMDYWNALCLWRFWFASGQGILERYVFSVVVACFLDLVSSRTGEPPRLVLAQRRLFWLALNPSRGPLLVFHCCILGVILFLGCKSM